MGENDRTILTDDAIDALVGSLLQAPIDHDRRGVLAIAGVAGSGKSTLAQRLVVGMCAHEPGVAAFIPMDGFHLRNADLDARGWRPRKGAPYTYDVGAYRGLLERFARRQACGPYPVYCRKAHEPVLSDDIVTPQTRWIVTEGQYVLCSEPPWSDLAGVLDVAWWLDVSREHARAGVLKRDLSVGRSAEEAREKFDRNDRLNIDYVLAHRREADLVLRWPDEVVGAVTSAGGSG